MYKLPGIIIIFLVATFGGYYLWQYWIEAATTIGGIEPPTFQADLKNTLVLQAGTGSPTFTRADGADRRATVTDFEGLIKPVKAGEARFEGARRVENLITYSEDFNNAVWVVGTGVTLTSSSVTANGANTAHDFYQAYQMTRGRTYIGSFEAKAGTARYIQLFPAGSSDAGFSGFDTQTGAVFKQAITAVSSETLSDGWFRFFVTFTTIGSPTAMEFNIIDTINRPRRYISTVSGSINIRKAQFEEVTGQANQNPSEYVSTGVLSAPYHGANVDGVKYFTTQNGNTVASNVVTEATGAPIPDAILHGYVVEGGRMSTHTYSEQFNTNWGDYNSNGDTVTANNLIAPSGQTVAETYTAASGANYHQRIFPGVTYTAASTTFSVYLKYISNRWVALRIYDGTEHVALFDLLTGVVGQTSAGVTSTITPVGNGWYRATLTTTTVATAAGNLLLQLSPANSINIGNNAFNAAGTESVGVWGMQLEAASFASSYIPTTSASVTRGNDVLTYPSGGNVNVLDPYSLSLEASLKEAPDIIRYRAALGSNQNYVPTIYLTQVANTGNNVRFVSSSGYGNGATVAMVDALKTSVNKYAGRMNGTYAAFFANGTKGTEVAKGTQVEITTLNIGTTVGPTNYLFGTVRNVKIWKKALTDAQLINLTSTNSSVSNSAVKKTTVGSDGPSFQADLKNTLDLQVGVGKPTFTRADGADRRATVTDFEGLIKSVKAGEARFEGARRVENLITNAFTSWNQVGTATLTSNYAIDPVGALTATRLQLSASSSRQNIKSLTAGNTGVYSIWVKATSANATFRLELWDNATGAQYSPNLTATNTWTRFSFTYTPLATNRFIQYQYITNDSSNNTADILIWGAQLEDVTGQANQNPSEYVSTGILSTPYHGANVDGVKYFTTQNGNTVVSNVVTEATGAVIPDATLHGYVAEGARTNLLEYSEQFFRSSVWTTNSVAFGMASTTAPDGSGNGNKMVTGNSTSQFYVLNDSSITSGTTYTQTVYAKAGGYNYIQIAASSQFDVVNSWVNYDLSTGLIGNKGVGSFTSMISALSNGWYRISVTTTSTGTGAGRFVIAVLNTDINSRLPSYAADGTSGIYLWGAQLEAGAFASSYIPTTSASVTRAAGALMYPVVGNLTLSSAVNFTTALDLWHTNSGFGGIVFSVNDRVGGANQNTAYIAETPEQLLNYYVKRATNQQLNLTGTDVVSTNQFNRIAFRSYTGNFKGLLNGVVQATQASGASLANPTSISIGYLSGGGSPANYLYGAIRNVRIWKKALTDTQLINLTSTNTQVSQSAVKKVTVNTSQNTKQTSGLVGLWSFNGTDIIGTTAYDRSGNSRNGTLVGGATKTIGKVGQAISFDGVDDYVNMSASYNGVKSVSFWIKPNTTTQSILELNGTDKITASGGTIAVAGFNGDATVYVNGAVSSTITNDWKHVVVTTPTGLNATAFTLGLSGGVYFAGKLDEVRLYNRVLSASEVKQLYNIGH